MSRSAEIIELLRALGERMDRLERLGEQPVGLEGADPEVVLILTALKTLSEKIDRLAVEMVKAANPMFLLDPDGRITQIREPLDSDRCSIIPKPVLAVPYEGEPVTSFRGIPIRVCDTVQNYQDLAASVFPCNLPSSMCAESGCSLPGHYYDKDRHQIFCLLHAPPFDPHAYVDPITGTVAD